MSMKKAGKSETVKNPANAQQKLMNLQKAQNVIESGKTQPHNAKKEALGPNTDR